LRLHEFELYIQLPLEAFGKAFLFIVDFIIKNCAIAHFGYIEGASFHKGTDYIYILLICGQDLFNKNSNFFFLSFLRISNFFSVIQFFLFNKLTFTNLYFDGRSLGK
jgi:hypothetical protein